MFRTTLKNIAARRLRLLTTGIAIILGVSFMAGTLVLTDTIGRTFNTLFADVNDGVDVFVRSDQALGELAEAQRGTLPDDVVAQVAQVDGVAAAEPTLRGYAQVLGSDGQAIGTSTMRPPTFGANWINTDSLNPFDLAEGRAPVGPGEVAIDRGTARLGRLSVGDRTSVLTHTGSAVVTVVGVVRFGNADNPAGASFVFFDTDTAQMLMGQVGRIDGVRVAASRGLSQADLASRVATALGGDVEVLTGDDLTAEDQDAVAKGLSFFNTFLVTFALVALFVGSFLIYNTFTILVSQRSRETALLRAIGASRRQVLGSVLGEALATGLAASGIGVFAGIGVAGLLKAMLSAMGIDVPAAGLVVTSDTIATSMLTGIIVAIASAVLPARRAARTAPIEAMRNADAEANAGRRRLAAGAAIGAIGTATMAGGLYAGTGTTTVGLGVALIFVSVATLGPTVVRPAIGVLGAPLRHIAGLPGLMGKQNAARNPRRTSSTAAALMIGVGLVGTITILASSAKASVDRTIQRSFTGDIVIDSGMMGTGTLSPQLAAEVSRLDSVQSVMSLRTTSAEIDGDVEQVAGVNAAAATHMFDLGATTGSLSDLGARDVALSKAEAEDLRVDVGDTVEVRFAETGVQSLTVRAVYAEDAAAGPIVMDLSAYAANVAEQLDTQVFVKAHPGTSLDAVTTAVERAARAYPQASVQDRDEFAAAAGAHIDEMLNMVYALLMLAIIIALIGIANTLALSVLERTRELGLLRAVGMTQRQLRAAVRWESVLVALLGAVLGVIVGTGFGWALVHAFADQGIDVFVLPITQLFIITVLAGVAGVMAAIAPARRAARLDVLRAIASN